MIMNVFFQEIKELCEHTAGMFVKNAVDGLVAFNLFYECVDQIRTLLPNPPHCELELAVGYVLLTGGYSMAFQSRISVLLVHGVCHNMEKRHEKPGCVFMPGLFCFGCK